MTGHDRQWLLNRRNFEGRWCGTSHWYLRQPEEEGGAGRLDLVHPARVITDTCYEISFSDDDTGLSEPRFGHEVNLFRRRSSGAPIQASRWPVVCRPR